MPPDSTNSPPKRKHAQFEDALNVPEQDRLWSEGWVQKFLQMWVWNVTENEGNSWF